VVAITDFADIHEVRDGTLRAIASPMAAVFALVFLFALASVGLMLKAGGAAITIGGGLALVCFVGMAAGVFYGLFRLARKWENEEPTGN